MAGRRPSRERIYAHLETQIADLSERLGGLPSPAEAADIWNGIWYEEAHHSTAIEGNTLLLKQVETLLAEGRVTGNRELKEYLEVKGYAQAAEWVYQQAVQPEMSGGKVTLTEVRQIYRLAMSPVWEVAPHPLADADEAPGSFRRHEIRAFPGGMKPVSWPLVPAEMEGWIRSARTLTRTSDRFPERVAELHSRFEQIHPFIDGNGRVGRLVVNLLLVRMGYPPAVIFKRQREQYMRALRRADKGDFGELGEMLARAILDNLHRFVVPAVAGPSKVVPLAALATSEMTASALRVAANRGRLQAVRGADGRWWSSRRWVEEYLGTRYRR